ncbi:hypothetical protein B0H16DRAFT_1882474 [Mycena metata]|uniref:Uncharacterized protein n=1 Tax=Mycena metata TaxID=1033252 RepID=A0AAD7JM36_9AGAR|nr:hypothetical protein B0H16DRAFT_1882474 [Mycena metata]
MLVRLEKRYKDCDQPVFLAALILNPFEELACFGPNANLNHLKCLTMVVRLYCRVMSRPDNDTPEEGKAKERQVSKAFNFMQYLSGSRDFKDFNAKEWEKTYETPTQSEETLLAGAGQNKCLARSAARAHWTT